MWQADWDDAENQLRQALGLDPLDDDFECPQCGAEVDEDTCYCTVCREVVL
jgi:transcription initiation factor IIE alpha subunit